MNRTLLLSLSLNALVLPVAGWMLWQQPQPSVAPLTSPEPKSAAAPAVPSDSSLPFHWSQIESPDYPTFIANLRGIGCPEHTIRLIVDGELQLILAEKLAAQASPQANISQPAFDQLEAEHLALLDHLLQPPAPVSPLPASATGTATASAEDTGSTPAATAAASPPPALTESIPAAFLVGDAEGGISDGQLSTVVTDSRLSAEDAAQINKLRQDFGAAVLPDGTSAPAPNSRDYTDRWRQAQRDSDDRFSSLYGGDALDALYRQQLLKASQAAAPAGN
jgi:hypothetical protein